MYRKELSVYTDYSQTSTGTRSGVLIEELGLNQPITQNNQCPIFQVEILAIKLAEFYSIKKLPTGIFRYEQTLKPLSRH